LDGKALTDGRAGFFRREEFAFGPAGISIRSEACWIPPQIRSAAVWWREFWSASEFRPILRLILPPWRWCSLRGATKSPSTASTPVDDRKRVRVLTEEFGMSEDIIRQLPLDRPTPPAPESRTAAAAITG
jgi:hypothetical protein